MSKMGRPAKAKDNLREKIIHIRVTADEQMALRKAAVADGKKLAPWARKLLLSASNVLQ